MIPVVRSWPLIEPDDRCNVNDHIPRLFVMGYDFRELLHFAGTGVVHLEWDIAIAPEVLSAFQHRAAAEVDAIRMVPYRLYKATTSLDDPLWAHDRWHVAFGCIYLPPWVLQTWKGEDEEKFNDTTLGLWLRRYHGNARIVIDKDLSCVHLHY